MKFRLLSIPASLIVAAGLMVAQSTDNGAGDQRQGRGLGQHGMFANLNLTDTQKEQAKTIFSSSRESNRAIEQQLRDARQALNEAAKSGATDAQIDQLATKIGPLSAQVAAAQAKTFAKFYAILTPEQRNQLGNGMFGGHGPAASNGFSHRHENGATGWRRADPQSSVQ